MPNTTSGTTINLLWTSGWDSTFQLLQTVLLHGMSVRPYYIMDTARISTKVERENMERIKQAIFKDHPGSRNLILPTETFVISDILPNEEITSTFNLLLNEKFMGGQYEWLARYCHQQNISSLQLSIHQDDKAQKMIKDFVVKTDDIAVYKVSEEFKGTPEHKIFQYYTFPLLDFTKVKMDEVAKSNGWTRYMHMTWFCHKPTSKMQPCGKCNPCRYTIEEGLGWRIPYKRRVIGSFYRSIYYPLKAAVKKILK